MPKALFYDKIQDELDCLTQKLLVFNPDTIAVEAAVHQQEAVSKSYQKFSLADLRNYEKMRNENLGNIYMFGETRPITYDNESIQIGYKLGKLLELDDIYAVDDDSGTSVHNETTQKNFALRHSKHILIVPCL